MTVVSDLNTSIFAFGHERGRWLLSSCSFLFAIEGPLPAALAEVRNLRMSGGEADMNAARCAVRALRFEESDLPRACFLLWTAVAYSRLALSSGDFDEQ